MDLSAEVFDALGVEAWASVFSPEGMARQTLWLCGDGWIVGYTTERIRHGKGDGKFAAMAYKPVGKGARSGDPGEHKRVYYRTFAKRKTAKARAEKLADQHTKEAPSA